jgi:hypothetical protein
MAQQDQKRINEIVIQLVELEVRKKFIFAILGTIMGYCEVPMCADKNVSL